MYRKSHILLLLCVAMLLPSVALGQEFSIFAKQKVVIADIRDKNDRPLSDGIKKVVRQGIIDACTNSNDYEVYEVSMDDIRQQLKASGQTPSFPNICKKIGAKADYIIFTEIKTSSSAVGVSSSNVTLFISSSLYRIATATEVLADTERAESTSQSIMEASARLVSKMLGIPTSNTNLPQQPSNNQSYNQQNGFQAQSSMAHGGVKVIYGYLKVFPNELGEFTSEPKTVIDQINKQGTHDYDTWRLPTTEELSLMRSEGLIGKEIYMTKGSSDKGIVLLVTDATETYSAKQEEKRIACGGLGDNGVYKVGYYYNRNGKQGVVFEVYADGRRGKIVSLQEIVDYWSCAKQWCENLGQGWRLPTRGEIVSLSIALKNNGERRTHEEYYFVGSEQPFQVFGNYWTIESEFEGSGNAWYCYLYSGNTYTASKDLNLLSVRAVSDF